MSGVTFRDRWRARWSRWVAFLSVEEDATPLALTRILLCTTLFVHMIVTWATGGGMFAWMHLDHGGISSSALARDLGPSGVLVLVAVTGVSALLGALGAGTRVALLTAWLGLRVLSDLNGNARGGYDAVMINTLFVLMLSGCGNALSIDAWRRGTQPALRFARLWVVFGMSVMYTGSVTYKLSWTWLPGGDASALWYTLQLPLWARFPVELPLWLFPITQLATLSVWLFEATAWLLIVAALQETTGSTSRFARLLQRVHYLALALAFGVAMHVGIEALMEVGPFSSASVALYPCALGAQRLARWRASLSRAHA